MSDLLLKALIEKTFIKNGADINMPHIKASLIVAASEMVLGAAETVMSKDEALNTLCELYGVVEGDEVANLLGLMSPSTVKSNIGYSVDFRDFGSAAINYQSNPDYARIYGSLKAKDLAKKATEEKTM